MSREFLEWLKTAPVSSGVCVCGNTVSPAGCGDHGSVDMWDHSLGKWLEVVEAQAVQLEEALVRLVAVEQNAANLAKWEQLLQEVRG